MSVEFALVGMAFFTLLAGIFEIALVAFADQLMSKATQNVARQVQIGAISQRVGGETAFREQLCRDVSSIFDCDNIRIRVSVFDNFAAATVQLNDEIPENLEDYEGFDLGGPEEIVVLRVLYEWPVMLLNPARGSSNRDNGTRLLIATTVVRNEPNAES